MKEENAQWEEVGVVTIIWKLRWVYLFLFGGTAIALFLANTELRAILGIIAMIFLTVVVLSFLLSKLSPGVVCLCGRNIILLESAEDTECDRCGRHPPPEFFDQ